MKGYYERPTSYNPDVAPDLPVLVWSHDRRKAMSRQRCADKENPKGKKRRDRREIITRGLYAKLGMLLLGDGIMEHQPARLRRRWKPGELPRASRELPLPIETYSIHEVLHARIPNCPRWFAALRAKAHKWMAQAVKHGPASGWGIPSPVPVERRGPKWTPFMIPKKSEKSWRWWRWLMLGLLALLLRMARYLRSLVPLHRSRLEAKPLEASGVEYREAQPGVRPMCRDKSADWVGSILGAVMGELRRRPVVGSEEAPIGG